MKSFLDFKSIDEQITEVLSKDASAGEWISDFIKSDNPKFAGKSEAKRKQMALAAYYAKQKNEAVMQTNGTDKVEPDAGMCQVCGATDCKEHFYKSPAMAGYVKEESGEHHDYSHVKKTMKKVDFDTYSKHMNKNDADHSMENKHKVDTQHSGSFTGKIHGAEVSHKVSGSGQKEYYIKEETLDEEFSNDTMKRIHKEYLYHKSRSTADVLKTHKGIHRVQSQNYTAGEMGGKEGLISDIMRNKHGKQRMDHYHSMKPSERKSLSEETLDEAAGYSKPKGFVEISKDEHDKILNKRLEHDAAGVKNWKESKTKRDVSGDPTHTFISNTGGQVKHGLPEVIRIHDHVKNKSKYYRQPVGGHVKEEVEQIDEISKETLGNYVHKSFARGNEIHKQLDKQVDDVQSPEERAKLKAELSKRNSGVIKAAQKMRNEDLEEQAPVAGALPRHTVVVHVSDPREPNEPKQRKALSVLAVHSKSAVNTARKHFEKKGWKVHSSEIKEDISVDEAVDHQHRIARDTVKNPNKALLGGPSAKEAEETLRKKYGYDDKKIAKLKEAVDMGQADRTLRSKDKSGNTYHVKDSSGKVISTHDNQADAMRGALKHDDHRVVKEAVSTVKKDASGKVIAWSHEGDWEKMSTKKQGTGKAANLAGKALQKTKTLNKEEAELEEGLFDNMPNTKAGFAYKDKKRSERQAEHEKQDPKMAKVYAKNMVDTAKAAKKANERGITKHADDFGWQVRNGVQRGKLPEEVELDEAWEVYDTKTRAIHSSHPTQRKALNAMNKLNDKHPGYETPGNLIASKFGARVSGLKEELDEATLQAHKVGVTVSDPNHTSVSQRKEKVQKSVIVKATDKGEAQAKAESFYKKKGYKVHDSFHHSVVPATSMKTEEVQIDEAAWGKDKATNLRQAHDRHMEKALAANKAGDDEAVKTHQRKMQMIQGKLQKLKNNEEVELGEECEILSELSKNALGNYVKAAAFDIANKGSAVGKAGNNLAVLANPKGPLTQLNKRLQGHAKAVEKLTKEEVEEFMQTEAYDQLDELDKKTLGSYVKKASLDVGARGLSNNNTLDAKHLNTLSKMSSRVKNINKAVDKLTKEEVEEIDELSKATLSSYIDKADKDASKNAAASERSERGGHRKWADKLRLKAMNRTHGIHQAINKLTKEDNMLTYSEFMAQLAESRADDLKDKLAADREARLNNYDYSKEKAAKKNPITKVKGHSYGAGDEDGEAEPTKAAEPAEKRGRGRPAGSKSGARA